MAEIVNGVYGADTATVNHLQFWFRSGNYKGLSSSGMPSVREKAVEKFRQSFQRSPKSTCETFRELQLL
ncbi:hypothetical protein TNCV_3130871 [Trichonephila clavipes]|nr:hypothetical protein TNCV_3130871 [Trichonephila clavipes]